MSLYLAKREEKVKWYKNVKKYRKMVVRFQERGDFYKSFENIHTCNLPVAFAFMFFKFIKK